MVDRLQENSFLDHDKRREKIKRALVSLTPASFEGNIRTVIVFAAFCFSHHT